MNEKYTGIDFGTTASAIGYYNGTEVQLTDLGEGSVTQPSAIHIDELGNVSTGTQAIEDFIVQNTSANPILHQIIPSIKMGLSDPEYFGARLATRGVKSNENTPFFPIVDLAAVVLSDLRNRTEQQFGKVSKRVVIGKPVKFSESRQANELAINRLERAALLAGFTDEVRFLEEPVAASLYFARSENNTPTGKVFVFDFGGGTLDGSIVDIQNNQVIATHGIPIGGNTIDQQVFKAYLLDYFGRNIRYGDKGLEIPGHLFEDLSQWHLVGNMANQVTKDTLRKIALQSSVEDKEALERLKVLIFEQQMYPLLNEIERAKIQLSGVDLAQLEYYYNNTIKINMPLTRKQFEISISELKRDVKEFVIETLKRANLKPEQVELVLKVGGSSKNPFVDDILNQIFSRVEEKDPFTSVVRGLAIASHDYYA